MTKKTLLANYDIGPAQLLNQGMEAEVYMLGMSVCSSSTPALARALVQTLQHFYAALDRQALTYALPEILAVETQDAFTVVIERRLVGRPLSELVAECKPARLTELLPRYLLAVLGWDNYQCRRIETLQTVRCGGHQQHGPGRLAPLFGALFDGHPTSAGSLFCARCRGVPLRKVTQMQTILTTPYEGRTL
ncbi:MAG: hypothetical protein R2932_12370 [Caldilineaceae bacterium]